MRFIYSIFILICASIPYYNFTLEDSYIFLASAEKFISNEFLVGSTSLIWGLISVLVVKMAFIYDISAIVLLKIFSFIFWLLSFFVIQKTIETISPLNRNKYISLILLYITLPISSWSFSGMDSSLALFYCSIFLYLNVKYYYEKSDIYLIGILAIASLAYIVRPELIWISFYFFIFNLFIYQEKRIVFIQLLIISSGILISFGLTYYFTGHIAPTSSSKIFSLGLLPIVSVIYFLIINSFFLMHKNLIRKYSGINIFIVSFIFLRLLEHILVGQIDHRALSYLLPFLISLFFLNNIQLTKIKFLGLLIIYGLNIYNFNWYSQRTISVHMKSLEYLKKLNFTTIATEEIGILSYYLNDKIIYDYHGLNGRKLRNDDFANIDVAIFTDDLMQDILIGNNFDLEKKFCYEYPRTLYLRSIGFTPNIYCKKLYVRRMAE